MRVLIAAVSRYSAPSGICRYADSLAASLSIFAKAQTTIAIGSWQEYYFRDIFGAASHSNVVRIDIRNNPASRNLWSISKLAGIARRVRADVVHLSYPIPFLRRLFSCPVVVTIHDLYPFDASSNFSFAFANRELLKLCLSQADAMVCISKATQHRLQELFPDLVGKRVVSQIYNPISTPKLEVNQAAVQDLRARNFVLAVAQHRKNKNLDILYRAFSMLLTTHRLRPDCQLVIVGSEGPETGFLHALADELGVAGNVRCLSGISESDLAWLYRNCLVMASPSSNEGLCMPIIEALLSGCRVVCSDIYVLREIGSEVCTYFQLQPEPVWALADAIVKGIALPQSTSIVNQHFAPASAAEQFDRMYRAVTSEAKASHSESPVF